jgi:hypothetical protein
LQQAATTGAGPLAKLQLLDQADLQEVLVLNQCQLLQLQLLAHVHMQHMQLLGGGHFAGTATTGFHMICSKCWKWNRHFCCKLLQVAGTEVWCDLAATCSKWFRSQLL